MLSQKFRLATLMLILSGSAWAADTPTPDPADTVNEARAMIDAGDYTGAMASLTAVLSQNPGNADALNLMGFASRKSGDLDSAAEYYAAALAVDPQHLGALEYQGELFIQLGDIAAAEANLALLAAACGACEEHADLAEALADLGS
jgi:tetratricopeptide (TPR) repeat protein